MTTIILGIKGLKLEYIPFNELVNPLIYVLIVTLNMLNMK